jgi:high-affinity iron transporter
MALIGPIVRNDFFFPVTMLALVALMVLMEYRRRRPATAVASSTAISKAEERKLEWSAQRDRFWAIAVCATAFVFMSMVTAEVIYAQKGTGLSPATELAFDKDGRITIATADLAMGDLRRYSVEANGTKVRFLLYRKPDGTVATVFDACQICGGVGFYKGASGLVCKNCASPVNPQSVGEPGGCNPLPLRSTQNGGSVVITSADLAKEAAQFNR